MSHTPRRLSRDLTNLRDPLARLTLGDVNAMSRLLAVCASLGLAACAAPASVEGVFSGDGFRLECEVPLAKSTEPGRDTVVVLSDHDAETLRTVSIHLPDRASLPLGKAVAVGPRAVGAVQPAVEVVVGDLVVDTRADGVEILSSENAVRASSVGGTLILDEASSDLAGRFLVDLDDGGYLEGAFVATVAE